MAVRWKHDSEGYDVTRFKEEVREDLLCSICCKVPKDPRLCQHEDHIFCFAHISQHLVQNSQTCPVCREPLNQETLRRPTGFLKNFLKDLRIKCDHHDRGCPDYVRLDHLSKHVKECEYAPVMCCNEGCGTEIKRRDIETHQKNFCQFRPVKFHDCKNIKKNVDEINVRMTATEESLNEMMASQHQMNLRMTAMERREDKAKQSMDEMRKQFNKGIMMMNQASQENITNKSGASAMDHTGAVNNQDIIIIGGWYGPDKDEVLNSVERYNIVEAKSKPLPQLNHPRGALASCVYSTDVLVVAGHDGSEGTNEIEVLKMSQQPLRWTTFDGKLPMKLYAHDLIVHEEKLYIIGGHDLSEHKISDAIYEIALTPPYTPKLLTRMTQPRRYHRVELVNGKLFILGGTTTGFDINAIDSVVVYDLNKNEFKLCPSLPQPVSVMSTVTWGNMIIIIGGKDRNGQALNDVVMYDTGTGRSERLPSMIYKRGGCSAVIMNGVIVVFGGSNKEQGYLKSVESLTIGGDSWKELPGMIEKRRYACAIVTHCR